MAALDSPRQRVVASVASSVAMPKEGAAAPPDNLRGRLQVAVDALPQEAPTLDGSEPFAVANVSVRSKLHWLGVRTGPELIKALTADVRRARTVGDFTHAARRLPQLFMSTGVYRDVSVSTEPAANHGKGTDLVVELDERVWELSSSAERSSRGQMIAVRPDPPASLGS